ncbi:acetolactate synthase, large subunit [Sporobacter termitidis DSM 10068]|uniref:Acetolactate synthase n=1 Tax=Sporobacter termitidis DSM 10068 TaxID=1123282 RepID=A0A1M5UVT6_9FIRM|nr:biosynthetic-type acetolactate synthase large subunit [Sporobacter termitidis]SHH67054.1 acetolactate synthase, large subunit [Sporobacter termitidis DSM 10068]
MLLTGAQIIIKVLIEQGVDTVFGYPGGTVLNIYDELYKHSDRIKHYTTCHEQGASHAADGYARVTGKTGVVIATSGPGATNLVTGIANAYLDSTPLVAITGNVATTMLGRDSFQEVDISGITMPITKHNYLVKDIAGLAETLREAFALARSGRPGPVLIDVTKDVQTGTAEFSPASAPPPEKPASCFDQAQLDEAAKLIREAKRPYIYCGGGVVLSGASAELIAFADRIDAPIGLSIMGLTAVPYAHPRFLGMVGMHGRYGATKALYESDLLIAVGTRFSDRATGNKAEFMGDRKVLQIDIDPAEIGKNIGVTQSLVGDVKCVLAALMDAVPALAHKEWSDRVRYIKEHPDNNLEMNPKRLTPQSVIEGACRRMGDGTVATDVGQHQMWTTQYYQFKKPRTFVTSGGLGAMGFGLGAAIGACVGRNFQRTLLFTSDGSFHMNLSELATAVTNALPLVIVVLNNQVLGMVRQWQTLFFDGRYSNTSLDRKTDFVKLAEAFGAAGFRAGTIDAYEKCLDEAFKYDTPVLIDCTIDSDERVLPMIPPGGSINDIILR